jgi:organic hydroperoxide reductase OsmC/OhrA
MSEYRTNLKWSKTTDSFHYDTYNRAHEVSFASGTRIAASSAPEYKGDADRVNPEEQLLGAISSCHMLTFLAIASKKGFIVTSYTDDASCFLEPGENKVLSVTRAILRPKIAFEGREPSAEELAKMHESAHRNCFIAQSVKTAVTIA